MSAPNVQPRAEDPCAESEPIRIRGRFLTAVVLPVNGAASGFAARLDALVAGSRQFLDDAPLILDLAGAEGLESEREIRALLAQLRSRRLAPIGLQNATGSQAAAALGVGLPTLSGGREAPLERKARPAPDEKAVSAATPDERAVSPPAPAPGARLVTEPVRSGQRVMAERGDLIVLAPVSTGAELIAEGNIHVYGPLRGRALAGVSGDRTARIFCQSLEADLIAIAGLYKTSETLGDTVRKARVQAFLEEDSLRIEALK